MGFYDDIRAVASDVIGEFKQGTVIYVELQPQAGATPDNPGEPVPVEHPINAVVRPVSTKYVDGSHIVQSDRQLTMPADGVEPTMEGSVKIDSKTYKIIEIMPNPAAGDPVTYTLIVRK
jgi:hypothetical protein